VVLTGEAPIQGLVTPKSPFDPTKGTWGALEIAARYGQLEIDPDVFGAGYADPEKSARRAQEWGVALNWHLNRNVKYVASFDRTTFTGGAASGANRKAENALFFRAQVVF
jgi:phosphate-selective porin OprO/OprP